MIVLDKNGDFIRDICILSADTEFFELLDRQNPLL